MRGILLPLTLYTRQHARERTRASAGGVRVATYVFVNSDKVPGDNYDFAAVVPEGATRAEFRAMLRNLLVERFHLRYHRETRELPLYELRVAPGGPRLKPTANEPPETNAPSSTRTPDGYLTFPRGLNTPFLGNGPRFSLQRVHTTRRGAGERRTAGSVFRSIIAGPVGTCITARQGSARGDRDRLV